MASLLSFLTALMRALPAVEGLVRQALAERDKEREREAQRRHVQKDAAVDDAINAAVAERAQRDHELSDQPKL